ncbi:FG-GAP-like repeat-containing protein [Salinibacter ruber]|uniref:Secretion system C-terminal sorting domain-containing protein n=1 Tax=Salinibacter ruber TaxID=146919 RepID=A0A9X2Q9R9_9BACT|nr:FG-GAP-like repeat-containing protein [Salinibacter ruber]MCS3711278.1 hypothetical protein [Salinibacter ruber]
MFLALGVLSFSATTAKAQQAGSGGGEEPALEQRVPAPGQGVKSLTHYLKNPEVPIPSSVKERVPRPVLRRIEQQRERLQAGEGGMETRQAPTPKSIGGFLEVESDQSWVLNENPNPSLNFDLTGTPQFAGDVNGDGTNDYLYATAGARDERSPEVLEDQTGKTALFYGGTPSEGEDQLVYAQLRPAGDLNGDGFDDALEIEENTARIWTGSENGYVDSGETVTLQFSPSSFYGNGVIGFTDLDGDGTDDALLSAEFGGGELAVLYGADSLSSAELRTYQPPTNRSEFAYNAADLNGDGQASIVRLEGDNFGDEQVRARVFEVGSKGSEIFRKNFQDGQLGPMTVINVSGGNGWGIGNFDSNNFARANAFGGAEASNSWLITPALDFNAFEAETLTFRNKKRFDDGGVDDPLQVKVSTDYDGSGNPENFTWTDVTDRVDSLAQNDSFVTSGEVDLSDAQFQSDEVYVAFRYQSSGTDAGTSEEQQVDDIQIVGRSDQSLIETQSFVAEELQGRARRNQLSLIDITGNDTLEIAATTGFNSETYVFGRDTDSTYAQTPDSLGKDDAVPIGDLDGDGRHDFYTFEDATGTRYVSYGPSDLSEGLSFDTEIPYDEDVVGAAGFLPEGGLGDVTGDGRPDAGLGLSDSAEETVGRRFFSVDSNRDPQTTVDVSYPEGHFFDRILSAREIGDFNGDGTEDFALVRFDLGQIEVFYGGSSISQTPDLTIESPIDESYLSITSGDFNGDGTSDIAAGYNAGSQIEIFLGGEGADGQVDHTISASDLEISGLYDVHVIGDVNDNGADDLIASNFSGPDSLAVFFGGETLPSTPSATIQYDGFSSAGETLAAPGDINGDGIDDFVVGRPFFSDDENAAQGRADVYFGSEDPSFSNPDLTLRPEFLSSNISGFSSGLAGGDFDGDGHGDIAVRPQFVSPGEDPRNVYISIFEGGPDADEQVDQRLEIPVETGVGREFSFDEDGLVNTVRGPLETVPFFGSDALIQGSGVSGTNAVLYQPLFAEGVAGPAAVFRAPNQDAGLGGFSDVFGGVAAGDFTGSGRPDVVFPQTRDNNDAELSSRVYRYAVSGIPVATANRPVDSNGEQDFRDVGLDIDASNVSGEDNVSVEKYLGPPFDPGVLGGSDVLARYIVEAGPGIEFGDGTEVQVDVSAISAGDNGGVDTSSVVIYRRPTVGEGVFSGLETTYDREAGTLVATAEPSGEFALAAAPDSVTVWAGDTNNDGTVDEADVLPLGTYWGTDGPARQETGCAWEGRSAGPWAPEAATYADANGDGTVDQEDVLCLGVNWGETRSKAASTGPALATSEGETRKGETGGKIVLQREEASGDAFWVEIRAQEVESLAGVATELTYDPAALSVETVEAGTRMGEDPLLQFNADEEAGTLGLGVSRKGKTTSKAAGPVARVKVRPEGSPAGGSPVGESSSGESQPEVSARSAQASTTGGQSVSLATGGGLESLPEEVALRAPAPNPVRQTGTLEYALPESGQVRLSVYDVLGREVAVLVNREQQAGRKQVDINASQWSSGTYFYRLEAGGATKTERFTVVH